MAEMPVSIRDVAARAGVSVGTASNVLNRPEIVADVTRRRVQAAIKHLGFVRNFAPDLVIRASSRASGRVQPPGPKSHSAKAAR